MSKSGLIQTIKNLCASVGLKEPWKMTGIRSLPEYEHYMPSGKEYRPFGPGTQPKKALIPHDSPKLVYDIKYFVRDYRRNNRYTQRTVDTKTSFDFSKMYANAPVKPEDVKTVPLPGTMPHRGY